MPFSHHSHSGQFCSHGEDTLEVIVRTAIQKKMQTFALTEHMPREDTDLYPEEVICFFSCVPRTGAHSYVLDQSGLESAWIVTIIRSVLP